MYVAVTADAFCVTTSPRRQFNCAIDDRCARSLSMAQTCLLAGRAVTYLNNASVHASAVTILAISFERYYAICWPLRAHYKCTIERTLKVIAFVSKTRTQFASKVCA